MITLVIGRTLFISQVFINSRAGPGVNIHTLPGREHSSAIKTGQGIGRAAERWERWERVPSQFEILAAILADDLHTFVAK